MSRTLCPLRRGACHAGMGDGAFQLLLSARNCCTASASVGTALGLPYASPGAPATPCARSCGMNTLNSLSKNSGAQHGVHGPTRSHQKSEIPKSTEEFVPLSITGAVAPYKNVDLTDVLVAVRSIKTPTVCVGDSAGSSVTVPNSRSPSAPQTRIPKLCDVWQGLPAVELLLLLLKAISPEEVAKLQPNNCKPSS